MADVQRPVTVWWGDDDQLVSADHTKRLVAGLPDARPVVVPGGGHSLAITEWRAILEDLLARTDAGASPSARH